MSEERTAATDGGVQTSLQAFGGADSAGGVDADVCEAVTERLTIHHDGVAPLLARGRHAETPTELVIMPSELHRRTLKRRLSRASTPRDAFEFVKPRGVADALLATAVASPPSALDRVDRLRLLETEVAENATARRHLQRVIGPSLSANVERVERACTTIESLTGYHPDRVAALRAWCEATGTTAAADTQDVLAGAIAVERSLHEQSERLVSSDAVVRRACRALMADASTWPAAFPAIDRVWVSGVSTVSAALGDLLASCLRQTTVPVHVGCRPASGPVIETRVPRLLSVATPGEEVIGADAGAR
jgi:ATP-dependent helicase/nuclease subunit B